MQARTSEMEALELDREADPDAVDNERDTKYYNNYHVEALMLSRCTLQTCAYNLERRAKPR